MSSPSPEASSAAVQAELAAFKPQHNVTITTERLLLRPVRPDDIHAIHAIRRKKEVMTFMSTDVETSDDPYLCHSAERIRLMMAPDRFGFAVELRAHDESKSEQEPTIIGYLGIFRPPTIAYIFDSAHWGRGYATEALGAFIAKYWEVFPQGLEEMKPEDKNMLMAYVFEGNKGSANVLKKIGFEMIRTEPIERAKTGEPSVDWVFQIQRPVKSAIPATATGVLL